MTNNKKEIEIRVMSAAEYIIMSRCTLKEVAEMFYISKTTAHKDLTKRLPELSPKLANHVKLILNVNSSTKHLKGGFSTRRKYKQVA